MEHRFFVETPLEKNREIVISHPGIVHQLTRVLRAKIADPIVLLDNSGNEFHGNIIDITKGSVGVGGLVRYENTRELRAALYLYQCLLKKDNMEVVCEKATELGVAAIIPVLSSRVIKTGLNTERAEHIIKEAAEQSLRGRLPALLPITSFSHAVDEATKEGENILFYEHADPGQATPSVNKKRINIFIGPEGGFSPEEVEYAKTHGFTIASLGNTRLRSETAAIVAVARIVGSVTE